jgi:hypothetical protein
VESAISAFSGFLVGAADQCAEQQQSGNPDKSVYQLRIPFCEPPSLDAATLRAAMELVRGLETGVNALADGAAR